jgi:1-acyl-sn-glycerol-3-phosphate acyltransferase
MIYRAIRKIVKIALFVFFKKIVVTGLENIPDKGAMFYWIELKRFVRVLHFYFIMKQETKLKLLALRDGILDQMEKARKSLG